VAPLRGQPLPRCAVHGDFWRGNIACRAGEIRVYDWEWATLEGRPYFDLWTYELARLRHEPKGATEALHALEAAQRGVEDSLRSRDLDPRFAGALLAPVAAELTLRVRRVRGLAPPNEEHVELLLAAVERVLLGD
jgi:hypothetical protein